MAINRKMLVSDLQFKNCNLTIFIPDFQTYPPPTPPPPPPQMELHLRLPTSIYVAGSVSIFIFIVIFLYLYITQPQRTSAATVTPSDTTREDEEETDERDFSDFHHVWQIPTVGLHRSEINSITVVGFKKAEGIIDGTECSVCLNEFEEDESLRLLPKCSHAFHINCIDTWLLSHKNCPLCRAPVLVTKPPPHQETETNHIPDSDTNIDLSRGQGSTQTRNHYILPRAQSDLANHCGSGRVENVRRSFSIGGSLSLFNGRSGRQFYTNFSANFSASRRSRNQDPILPSQMTTASGD